jgi:MFS family permease
MQSAERVETVPLGHTYAEPLSGLRVSWGSVLAGAVAMIAVALILWSLALAIVSLATHPTASSFRGSAYALWMCAMATTLVGALVGGYLAGYLPGSTRPGIFAAHGFLAWCVALLLSFAFGLYLARGTAMVAASAAAESTRSTEPNSVYERGAPSEEAMSFDRTGDVLVDSMVGISWSWFGTWVVALGLAVGGAALGARRLRNVESPVDRGRREPPMPAEVTPAPGE